ncbi:hypothetical protein M011DRAFT_482373 [Sporormia fimetaria CBS 119925]|uniref:Uncharacterized protein n=1 Tax=Sporormia fimetaria CBS 119925 TaxID=1340428 RepID=A0A6A6UW23_9PLEO|nr:hypothetical protein M011DRAFT_482373 [Sporormia fimetaria CBS 119925]
MAILTHRQSRFSEASMNSTTSTIRPPPERFWNDFGTTVLSHTTSHTSHPSRPAAPRTTTTHSLPVTQAESAGFFGRMSRAAVSLFGWGGRKRVGGKSGSGNAGNLGREVDLSEERKREAERAYKEAKERGLLPRPRVYVRPGMQGREGFASPRPITPAKEELARQHSTLRKRLSSLETRFEDARRKLDTSLSSSAPVTVAYMTTPLVRKVVGTEASSSPVLSSSPVPSKRKRGQDEDIGIDCQIDVEEKENSMFTMDSSPPHKPTQSNQPDIPHVARSTSRKRPRKSKSRTLRAVTRTQHDNTQISVQPKVGVRVVPDGERVPPVPVIPRGVRGKRARVTEVEVDVRMEGVEDDGFGGYGHEVF